MTLRKQFDAFVETQLEAVPYAPIATHVLLDWIKENDSGAKMDYDDSPEQFGDVAIFVVTFTDGSSVSFDATID